MVVAFRLYHKSELNSVHNTSLWYIIKYVGTKRKDLWLASLINTVHIVTLHSYLAFKFNKTTSLMFHFKLLYRSVYIDIAMHCRTDTQSWRLTEYEWWERTVQKSASHSALRFYLWRQPQSGVVSGHTSKSQKAVNCMGLTAPKSMHIGPSIGNRVTYEGKMWHMSWALKEQQAAVVLTALTIGHRGRGDIAGLLSEDASV